MSEIRKSETLLAEQVIKHLERKGWEVYREVMMPRSYKTCDIVAIKDGIVWAIETKTTFNDTLLEQANNHLRHVHYVSVATPCSKYKSHTMSYVKSYFMKNHGIGHMIVDDYKFCDEYYVRELITPTLNDKPLSTDKLLNSLHELHKSAIAGGQSGEAPTPFKITIHEVKKYLKENGPSTIGAIADNVKHHYKTDKGLKTGLPSGISMGYVKGIIKCGRIYKLEEE